MNRLEYLAHIQKIDKLKTKKTIEPLIRSNLYDYDYNNDTYTQLYKFAIKSLLFKKYGPKKELLPAMLKRPHYKSIKNVTKHLVESTASLKRIVEATQYTPSLYVDCPSLEDFLMFNRTVEDYVFQQGIYISRGLTSVDNYITDGSKKEQIDKIKNLPLFDIGITKTYKFGRYSIGEVNGELSRETIIKTLGRNPITIFATYVELILNRKQLDQNIYYTYYDGIIDKLETHYAFTKEQVRQIFQNEIDKII